MMHKFESDALRGKLCVYYVRVCLMYLSIHERASVCSCIYVV